MRSAARRCASHQVATACAVHLRQLSALLLTTLQAVPSGRLVTFSSYDDYTTVTSRLANATMGPRPEDAAAFWTGAMLTSGGRWAGPCCCVCPVWRVQLPWCDQAVEAAACWGSKVTCAVELAGRCGSSCAALRADEAAQQRARAHSHCSMSCQGK